MRTATLILLGKTVHMDNRMHAWSTRVKFMRKALLERSVCIPSLCHADHTVKSSTRRDRCKTQRDENSQLVPESYGIGERISPNSVYLLETVDFKLLGTQFPILVQRIVLSLIIIMNYVVNSVVTSRSFAFVMDSNPLLVGVVIPRVNEKWDRKWTIVE